MVPTQLTKSGDGVHAALFFFVCSMAGACHGSQKAIKRARRVVKVHLIRTSFEERSTHRKRSFVFSCSLWLFYSTFLAGFLQGQFRTVEMARSLCLVWTFLFTAQVSFFAMAAEFKFKTCRLPIHDTYKNYNIMFNPYSHGAGEFICIDYRTWKSLGLRDTDREELVVPVRCVIQDDGTAQLRLAPEGREVCRSQKDPEGSARSCNVHWRQAHESDPARKERESGLRLTGQTGASSSVRYDNAYVTHDSIVCEEKFGEEGRETPRASVWRCNNGVFQFPEEMTGLDISPSNTYSCKELTIKTM